MLCTLVLSQTGHLAAQLAVRSPAPGNVVLMVCGAEPDREFCATVGAMIKSCDGLDGIPYAGKLHEDM